MGLIVKDVHACMLPSSADLPDGCIVQPDCSCAFSNGSYQSYKEWKALADKNAGRAESSYFVIIIVIVVLGVFVFKRLRRKLRAINQI